jgi:hypothetical protein
VVAALVMLSACAGREEGLVVPVTVVVDGVSEDWARATLSVEVLSLTPCVTWWQRLSPVSTAWAHDTSDTPLDPRTLAVPMVVDLLAREPQELGVLHPPPGEVCGVTLTLAPSTGTTRSQGTTLLLERPGALQLSTAHRAVTLSGPARSLNEMMRAQPLVLHVAFPGRQTTGDATIDALGWSLDP